MQPICYPIIADVVPESEILKERKAFAQMKQDLQKRKWLRRYVSLRRRIRGALDAALRSGNAPSKAHHPLGVDRRAKGC